MASSMPDSIPPLSDGPPAPRAIHAPRDITLEQVITLLKTQPLGMRNNYPTKINSWIPNFAVMEYAMNQTYEMVMTSHYANRELRDNMLTAELKLYYFTVAWYHILRIARPTGITTPDQNDFVDYIEKTHPHESIPIDGFMKIWFIALAQVNPDDPKFKTIVPYIPPIEQLNPTAGNYHTFASPYFSILPGINQLLRILRRPMIGFAAGNLAGSFIEMHPWELNQVNARANDLGNATSNNRMHAYLFMTPGCLIASANPTNWITYANHPYATDFPDLRNNVNYTTELGYFHLGRSQWFSQTKAKMVRFARYISGSTSLSDISSIAHGIGHLTMSRIMDPELAQAIQDLKNDVQDAAPDFKPEELDPLAKDATPEQKAQHERSKIALRAHNEREKKIYDANRRNRFVRAQNDHATTSMFFRNNTVWKQLISGRLEDRQRNTPENILELCWMTGFKMPSGFEICATNLGFNAAYLPAYPRNSGPFWNKMILEFSDSNNDISDSIDYALGHPTIRIVKPKD